jgi:hypothetical protein
MSSKPLKSAKAPADGPSPQVGLSVLHRETHRHLRLNRRKPDYGFARSSVTVALSASEVPAACMEYPCVMARLPDGSWSLLAVTGLQTGHNLFVAEDGSWLGTHLPATLATWPFRLMRETQDPSHFVVAVQLSELNEAAGDPLFDAAGAEAPWLMERLRELVETDAALKETARQIAMLDQAGVLIERSFQAVLADGRDVELNGFWVVDEAKLQALPADAVHQLHAQGVLWLAYLQLLSVRRFRPLVVLAGRGAPASSATANTTERSEVPVAVSA